LGGVIRHAHGARDSLGDIGDDAVSPPTDLVPEEPEASSDSRADGSLQDHAASFPVHVGDRSLLDHEAALGSDDDESRVIEVVRTSSLGTGGDRLEQLSTQPHDVLPRAQRDPVEIHGCGWLARFLSGLAFLVVHANRQPDAIGRR
jgi:hypothetical protein